MNPIDALGMIGGQQGQQGGVATITKLFGDNGLQGIMAAMQSNGLGQHVQSWVGNGQNMPISGSDVMRLVDQQQLTSTAQQQGMEPQELADHVAHALPHLVDQATPTGQVPQQASSTDALVSMFKR